MAGGVSRSAVHSLNFTQSDGFDIMGPLKLDKSLAHLHTNTVCIFNELY